MKVRSVAAILTLFSLVSNSFASLHHVDTAIGKVTFKNAEDGYRLMYPKDVKTVESDGDYLYMAADNEIYFSAQSDIEKTNSQNSKYGKVGYWKISLAKELKGRRIADIAVHKIQGTHIIHVTSKNDDGSYKLQSYAVRGNGTKQDEILNSLETQDTQTVEVPYNDIGLFTIKGGLNQIMGNGQITVVKEPNTGGGLLLSLDPQKDLIHAYRLDNPLEPKYRESYQVPMKGQTSLRLVNNGITGASFGIESDEANTQFSVYELRSQMVIKQTNALIALENEIHGNAWMRNFLMLGLFNTGLDSFDSMYGNPNVSIADMEKDPVFAKLSENVTDDEVFEYLIVNKLMTQEQANQLMLDRNLNAASGTKWFVTVAAAVGMLKYFKSYSKAASYGNALNHFKEKLFKFTTKVVRPNTIAGRYVYRIGEKVDKVQTKLKARLMRNFYNMEYPHHAIVTLRKQMLKAKLLTKDEVKSIKKLPLKKQYEQLIEVAKKNEEYLTHAENVKLKNQLDRGFEIADASIGKVEIIRKLRSLKAQTMALLKKYHPDYKNIDLKSDDAIGFIHATDKKTIMDKVKELKDVLVKLPENQRVHYSKIEESISKNLSELEVYQGIVAKNGTEGRVAKHWDVWARWTQKYEHYFLSERFLRSDNRVAKYLNEHARPDAVLTSKGVEYIKIEGEHAKSAFYLGISDTIGEIISQTTARRTLIDPNEWSIGSGDNHLELVTINGKEYGIHFDLLVHAASNLAGWWIGMPLGLAASGFGHGAKGKVTLTQRVLNSIKKGYNPVNYLWGQLTLSLPILGLSNWMVKADYRADHADNFDAEAYAKFEARIDSRLLSFKSFGERKLMGTFVNVPYVHPQFYMQAEFDKVARSLFNSSLPGTLVSSVVMPLTSGFYPNKAFGNYFGTNNPEMIKMLKRFGAEGIFDKIDEKGTTDINSWTEAEKNVVLNVILALEMAKEAKVNPLPRTAYAEEQSDWMANVMSNLFGRDLDDRDFSQLSPVIAVADLSKSEFRYEQEVIELNKQLDEIKNKTAILPFVQEPMSDNSFFLVSKESESAKTKSFVELKEITDIQAKLSDALSVMQQNRGSLNSMQKTAVTTAVYDTLFLLNSLVLDNKIYQRTLSLISTASEIFLLDNLIPEKVKTGAKYLNGPSKTLEKGVHTILESKTLLVFSLLSYLWIDNQIEAHIKIEEHLTNLIAQLQNILFSMTKVVVNEAMKGSVDAYSNLDNLDEYLEALKEKEKTIQAIVDNSQIESEKYLDSRVYRFPKILEVLGPIGMGISGGWVLSHWLLFKNSKGFVKKMGDRFAPGLFKYSFVMWVSMMQINDVIDDNIYLSTVDFLSLHPAYYTTLLEIELVKEVIKAKQNIGFANMSEIEERAISNLESNESLSKYNDFRMRLDELSRIGSKDKEGDSEE